VKNEIESGAETIRPKFIAYDLFLGLKSVWTVNQVVEMVAGPRPIDGDPNIKYQWTRIREIIRQALMDAIKTRKLVPLNEEWVESRLIELRSGTFGNGFEFEVYRCAELKREDVKLWMFQEQIVDTLQRQGHQVPSETIGLIEGIEGINQNRDIESSSNEIKEVEKNAKALIFRKNGETWEVGFENVKNIKHLFGMTYIQYLLIRPNNSIPCLDLELTENRMEDLTSSRKFLSNDEDYKKSDENHDVNKSKEKQDVDASLYVLKNELRDAKNAAERAEEEGSLDAGFLREEYRKVLKYLKSLYDKNGNLYEDKIEAEKARKRVSKAIETARKNIIHHLPELDEILKYLDLGHSPIFNLPTDSPRLEIIAD